MRVTPQNLLWAATHPAHTLRYLRWRDVISYEEIERHLPPDPVILEAGAANGQNSREMAEFWPGATLHAFEPVPGAKELLDRAVKDHTARVKTWPYALGDQAGSFEMNVSGEGEAGQTQSSSLLEPTGHHQEYDFVTFKDKITVEVVRLDDWAAAHGVERIDFMWLDLQGYELKALAGGERMLATASCLHVEVHHRELYAGAPLYRDVKAWLGERGFRPVVEATFRVGGNVLFTRRG